MSNHQVWQLARGTNATLDTYRGPSGELVNNIEDNHLYLQTGADSDPIKIANYDDVASSGSLPVGTILAYAGNNIPTSYLLCDGQAVSRTDYANLFSVIGTTYGEGDGSTTFNLPNLIDKFIAGSNTAGTVKDAGLPNIEGNFAWGITSGDDATNGVFTKGIISTYGVANNEQATAKFTRYNIDASRSNSIYGNSTTVQPPALTMRYIIKAFAGDVSYDNLSLPFKNSLTLTPVNNGTNTDNFKYKYNNIPYDGYLVLTAINTSIQTYAFSAHIVFYIAKDGYATMTFRTSLNANGASVGFYIKAGSNISYIFSRQGASSPNQSLILYYN